MDLPPIHLINLDRNLARLQSFRQWNADLSGVERFSAVDGAAIEVGQLAAAGLASPDFACGAGSLGCALSHIKLWQRALERNSALTILEDDVVVAHRFQAAASRVIADLAPDWDIIKWGFSGNLTAWLDVGLSTMKVHWDWSSMRRDQASLRSFQTSPIAAAPVRMLQSLGLFAYSISPKGARMALDFCLPLTNRQICFPDGSCIEASGIDALLCGVLPEMQAFACMPNLALHADNGQSDRMQLDQAGARARDA